MTSGQLHSRDYTWCVGNYLMGKIWGKIIMVDVARGRGAGARSTLTSFTLHQCNEICHSMHAFESQYFRSRTVQSSEGANVWRSYHFPRVTPLLLYISHESDDTLSRVRSKPSRQVGTTSPTIRTSVHSTALCNLYALMHRPKAYLSFGQSRTIMRIFSRIGQYLCIGTRWDNGWIK